MSKKLVLADIIARSIAIHGDMFDFSEAVVVSAAKPIAIICRSHGVFHKSPSNLLLKTHPQGCPSCTRSIVSDLLSFLEKAVILHGTTYDYSKVLSYTNSTTKVPIICREHGEFLQTPSNHLQGKGCYACRNSKPRSNLEAFVGKAIVVHQGKYTYTNSIYITSQIPMIITCSTHGDFSQQPNNHLMGKGCPKCGLSYSNIAKRVHSAVPTVLYYVYFQKYNLWKIGCTIKLDDVTKRFKASDGPVDVLMVRTFEHGSDAYKLEAQILQHFSSFSYQGSKLLKSKGNSELFTKDIIVELVDYIGTTVGS